MIKYREISGFIFLKKLLKELKQLLKIGIPIYGSQISYMGMGVTDTIVAGRASALDLSGLAIGNALSMPFYFLLGGCLFAVTPIVAQLFGAKKYEEIGQKVREILWVSIALGLIGFILYRNLSFFIPYFDIEEILRSVRKKRSTAEVEVEKSKKTTEKPYYFCGGRSGLCRRKRDAASVPERKTQTETATQKYTYSDFLYYSHLLLILFLVFTTISKGEILITFDLFKFCIV